MRRPVVLSVLALALALALAVRASATPAGATPAEHLFPRTGARVIRDPDAHGGTRGPAQARRRAHADARRRRAGASSHPHAQLRPGAGGAGRAHWRPDGPTVHRPRSLPDSGRRAARGGGRSAPHPGRGGLVHTGRRHRPPSAGRPAGRGRSCRCTHRSVLPRGVRGPLPVAHARERDEDGARRAEPRPVRLRGRRSPRRLRRAGRGAGPRAHPGLGEPATAVGHPSPPPLDQGPAARGRAPVHHDARQPLPRTGGGVGRRQRGDHLRGTAHEQHLAAGDRTRVHRPCAEVGPRSRPARPTPA